MPEMKRWVALATLALCLGSCTKQKRTGLKETFPVSGQVLVDGAPAENVAVTFHDVKGLDAEQPTLPSAYTDKEGKFKAGTYDAGDGVPEGEYALTFRWTEVDVFRKADKPDKLNNRYADKAKSETKVTVKKGTPVDPIKVELKTK